MRHLFDQYGHWENRLTHALVSCLNKDKKLLRDFIYWVMGVRFPLKEKLYIIEQSIPGKAELDEDVADRRGLPDAWIYNDKGWALLVESKVQANLTLDQLRRHLYTANRHAFIKPKLLTIEVENRKKKPLPGICCKTWQEIYEWGRKYSSRSEWADLFTSYFEVAEAKMIEDGYLKKGTLTRFTGIPFNSEYPYSYAKAKRLLRLMIQELKHNKKLVKELRIDPDLSGYKAIGGTEASFVWDFLRVTESKGEASFTKYPHLTLGISAESANMMLTIPNGVKNEIKNRLFELEYSDFIKVFSILLSSGKKVFALDRSVKPHARLVQRHYRTQRSLPTQDALLSLDLRTAFKQKIKVAEKFQPEWLKTAYDAMRNRRSNLQFQVGFEVYYKDSKIIGTPKAIHLFEEALFALKPILDLLLDRSISKH